MRITSSRLVGKVRFLHIQRRIVEELAVDQRHFPARRIARSRRLTLDELGRSYRARSRFVEPSLPSIGQSIVSISNFPQNEKIEPIVTPSGRRLGRFVRERRRCHRNDSPVAQPFEEPALS